MKRPRVRIETDEPPPPTTCFLHGSALPCKVCVQVRSGGIKDAAELPCPRCQTVTKARLLLGRWSAVCPSCRCAFEPTF